MESPPEGLIELATTSADDTEEIISWLNRLGESAEFWRSLRSAMPEVREFVRANPEKAELIANHLYMECSTYGYFEVPEDFQFVYAIEDGFALAGEGIFGSRRRVYRRFMKELEKF